MCSEAIVNNQACRSVGELRKALGGPVVTYDLLQLEDGDCLCSVDMQATATANKMSVRQDWEACGDFVFAQKPA